MVGEMNFSIKDVESIKYKAVYSLFIILSWCSILVDSKNPI